MVSQLIAIFLIIGAILYFYPTTYTEYETRIDKIPLSYENNSLTILNKSFLEVPILGQILPYKEAQITVKNTDEQSGSFYANFIFSNENERRTETKIVTLKPNEMSTITSIVPDGFSSVDVQIIPGTKDVSIPVQITKQKGFLQKIIEDIISGASKKVVSKMISY